MKFQPDTEDHRFNDWYREFHLLFGDSYADEEECLDTALSFYERAREGVGPVAAVPLLTSNYHADDLMGAMAEALVSLHNGNCSSMGTNFAMELSRRCNARFAKEMEK